MKIAGRKNDGAWYRANKFLKLARTITGATTMLKGDGGLQAAYGLVFDTIQDIATRSGATDFISSIAPAVETAQDLLDQHMETGIPRQVYMGELSYDVYERLLPNDPFPAECYVKARKGDSGAWTVLDGELLGQPPQNTKAYTVYAERNKYRMAAAGVIIRDRINRIRLTVRQALDFANQNKQDEGNPGGVADALIDV